MTPSVLRVNGLSAGYGRMLAVRGIDIDVPLGGAVAIVGPNGAGKSTTLNAIAGGVRGASGSISLHGEPIQGMKPEAIARLGISLVPEGRHVFASLTVRENLFIGSYIHGNRLAASTSFDAVMTYFPRLKERVSQPAGKLSGGEQQMLVIGRALMTRPQLLLIDEPSLGLAPRLVEEVYEILMALRRDEALSLLINEQNSKRVLKYMDEIYVIREGRIQMKGLCADLRTGDAVSDAYFGHGTFARSASGKDSA